MNQPHIHLIITHLPIFGSIFGALVLLYGIGVKSDQTKIAAYYLFVVSAIGAIIAYLTGESAEESVENIQGILESSIEEHEESATLALISLSALGLSSIVALYLTFKKFIFNKVFAIVVLVISLLSFVCVARTGYLGGQIRHTEINTPANGTPMQEKDEAEQD